MLRNLCLPGRATEGRQTVLQQAQPGAGHLLRTSSTAESLPVIRTGHETVPERSL
jgi:hypothetical protein